MTSADPAPSAETTPGSFAEELRSLYEVRQRAEADIAAALAARRTALAEADRIVADAQQAAADRQAVAATRGSLVLAEARGRAEQILAEANGAAGDLVADAEREAAPVRRDAEATRAQAQEVEAAAAALVEEAEREADIQRRTALRATADLRAARLAGILQEVNAQVLRLDSIAQGLDAALGAAAIDLADERLTMTATRTAAGSTEARGGG